MQVSGSSFMFDVDKIPEVIERGEQATRAQLPHIKGLLEAKKTFSEKPRP